MPENLKASRRQTNNKVEGNLYFFTSECQMLYLGIYLWVVNTSFRYLLVNSKCLIYVFTCK